VLLLRTLDEPVCPAFDIVGISDRTPIESSRYSVGSLAPMIVNATEARRAHLESVTRPIEESAGELPHTLELIAFDSIQLAVAGLNRPARSRRASARYRRCKRIMDVTLASGGLIASAPLISVLAILIKLDSSGPVFFRQMRVGEGGTAFSILKLRTMDDEPCPCHSLNDSAAGDQGRVTRVGRFLRRWSLDEVPQFINVLRGDMSLVGPRPERPDIVLACYDERQYQRFLVPQGMTGWWQVVERGRTQLRDDTESDLYYLTHASLLFDLKILLMTLPALVRQAWSA
jgi:lipopolysaccharide/colanic/teichoic acid biosynthesis glycosyltransferase